MHLKSPFFFSFLIFFFFFNRSSDNKWASRILWQAPGSGDVVLLQDLWGPYLSWLHYSGPSIGISSACWLGEYREDSEERNPNTSISMSKGTTRAWFLFYFSEKVYFRSQILERPSIGEYCQNNFVYQYCMKMWYLRSLEHAGVIQKLTILEC